MSELTQPPRDSVFLPRRWFGRYRAVRLTRRSDEASIEIPMTASINDMMDFNPLWFTDRLVQAKGRALFTTALDVTNSCTDACPMCFTMAKRKAEGLREHVDVDLVLRRIGELRSRYPETLRLVAMAGSGEPLNLPGVVDLVDGIREHGASIHLFTAGKSLRRERLRTALLRCAVTVRVSLDAADEETFREVHQAEGLAERIESIRQLAAERDAAGSQALLGVHFVVQKANAGHIVRFGELAREIGVDYVSFSQESYGSVAGGFTEREARAVALDLAAVAGMQDETFTVIVPRTTARPTLLAYDRDFVAGQELLDGCHFSRQHVAFGVRNDYSACCLSIQEADHRTESLVGALASDTTMDTMRSVIDRGIGTAMGRPLRVSCRTCQFNSYNSAISQILDFLDAESSWESALVPYVPGGEQDDRYELVMGGRSDGETLAVGDLASVRRMLPVVNLP